MRSKPEKTAVGTRYPSARWAGWAAEIDWICAQLVQLVTKRKLWRLHNESLEGRVVSEAEGVVHEWLRDNYVDSMTTGLRRVLDKSPKTRSFVKLLEDLRNGADELRLENFAHLYRSEPAALREWIIKDAYGAFSVDGEVVDPRMLREDLKRLRGDYKAVTEWTNAHVTHSSKRAEEVEGLTYEELHRAFDDLAELANKYSVLLTGGSMAEFEAILPLGVRSVFQRLSTSPAEESTPKPGA